MHAIKFQGRGGPEAVSLCEVPKPVPRGRELLVEVHHSAINRGDLLQRQGEYHVPAGQSTIPGVEVAGTVVGGGEGVTQFHGGEAVYGVVEGGGWAEYCLLDEAMANPLPASWSFREAAAAAEAGLTANETLFTLGELQAGMQVLIHAAASSIGVTMIQMVTAADAIAYGTVGSPAKAHAITALGARAAIVYPDEDFVARTLALTDGRGVDLGMDFVGGSYLGRNLAVLRPGGCLVLAGLLDDVAHAPLDLLDVIQRRIQIKGSSLRLRSMAEKRGVNQRYRRRWAQQLEQGALVPVIHADYPLTEVNAALAEMQAGRNIGKLVLRVAGCFPGGPS